MDDWVLATYNIPSVTGEIGNESDFLDEWTVSSENKAFEILTQNQPWLEHTYLKIGSQLRFKPQKYQILKESEVNATVVPEPKKPAAAPITILDNDLFLQLNQSNVVPSSYNI